MDEDRELRQDVMDELQWEPGLDAAAIGVACEDEVITMTGHVPTYHDKLRAEAAAKRVGVMAVANDLIVHPMTIQTRDDTDIAKAAKRALEWNVSVPEDAVTVIVTDGRVTLEGEVEWRYQRSAAETAVRYLLGVKGVSNQIRVVPAAQPTEVRQKIRSALTRSAALDADRIQVNVTGTRITLSGNVRSWAERDDAENAAWAAPGVTSVTNELMVRRLAAVTI
ncbi:MAG: BON domain-containing protein [Gemmatimonadota bacterium]